MGVKGQVPWNKGLKGFGTFNKGKVRSKEARENISKSQIGRIPWNKGKKGLQKFTDEAKVKKSISAKNNPKLKLTQFKPNDERLLGNKNPNWKGGVTPLNKKIRHSNEYKLWRRAVFERDNYTCRFCGIKSKKGIKVILHADHIKPFALFPELRFAIDNGRTLCLDCHKKTDSYPIRLR
jgi:hypothetical protein